MREIRKEKNKGITLIALIVTIIVLLILAGVSIATINGRNGLMSQTTNSAKYTKLAEIKEAANLVYTDLFIKEYGENDTKSILDDVKNIIEKDGYVIEKIPNSSDCITEIYLSQNSITIAPEEEKTITVNFLGNSENFTYYAVVDGRYYLMTLTSNGIEIANEETDTETLESGITIQAQITNGNTASIKSIVGNKIIVKGENKAGKTIITAKCGECTSDFSVGVVIKPTNSTIAQGKNLKIYNTNYMTIDVIWLDTDNNVISSPNEPKLVDEMTKVTWTYDEVEKKWKEDEVAKSTWYNYEKGDEVAKSTWYNYEKGDGKTDTKNSMWANVKMPDGSYFVWIPRYAYRITYYSDKEMTDITAYFDGYGLWDKFGNLRYKLNENGENGIGSEIKTVMSNGENYIVHPAFVNEYSDDNDNTNDFLNGGWDSDLEGFWVTKYELSGTASQLISVPNGQSWLYYDMGRQYTVGRQYNTDLSSHIMKNSEWGAVAYLTQSQYGRNGHEVSVNQNYEGYTGAGRGLNSTEDKSKTGTSEIYNNWYGWSSIQEFQKYNGTVGVLSSSTGNVYGIYDISGGVSERVAIYDSNGLEKFLNGQNYGKAMIDEAKDGENYISTKYITKYTNLLDIDSGSDAEKSLNKIGDALIEVNRWIGSEAINGNTEHVFDDRNSLICSIYPFSLRGGNRSSNKSAGIFSLENSEGASDYYGAAFRYVLAF